MAESINAVSLVKTVSKAGTWVKRIGVRERDWIAGREREVWGWAVRGIS